MEQISIFDCLYDTYKIKKPIRLIEFFAGIGSQAKALENLKANFEHWKICEWAIPSILAYNEIHQDYLKGYGVDYSKDLTKEQLVDYLHNKGISSNYNEPMSFEQIKRQSDGKLRDIYNAIISENNLVNIQQTHGKDLHIEETDKYDYILSYSFPCQDLSISGKMGGMAKGSGTRSGMLWEVERILLECDQLGDLPQVLLMENVPQVIGEKNIEHFKEWQAQLDKLGYTSYCEILNAKDYGVPQNRDRCFMVSILGQFNFKFPTTIKLNNTLLDTIDNNVSSEYNLKKEELEHIKKTIKYGNNFDSYDRYNGQFELWCRVWKGIAPTLVTRRGIKIYDKNNNIRYLTSNEYYRLMGFSDLDKERASKVISDSMIFHTAGDSIVVNVLMAIFSQLL